MPRRRAPAMWGVPRREFLTWANPSRTGEESPGTYTPSRATLHLYGKDLPKSGIHGVARPTLLELVSSASIRSAGPLVADQPTIELQVAALGLTFPVYPEGVVTLRLPVILTAKDSATAVLSVTYMACSDRICLAPVIDKRIAVRIPALAASAP